MERDHAKRLIEGTLFLSEQPVSLKRLKDVVSELDPAAIRSCLEELNADYATHHHAFQIQEVAGGYQLVTDPGLSSALKRALELPRPETLSRAALETLAIIAYRQPITKAEIELVRGVDGSATLETLLEHQFARVVGRKDTPGRPLLYGTTTEFLRHFGLKALEELPAMPQDLRPVQGFEAPGAEGAVPPSPPTPAATSVSAQGQGA